VSSDLGQTLLIAVCCGLTGAGWSRVASLPCVANIRLVERPSAVAAWALEDEPGHPLMVPSVVQK
jgi:hypothetical protein